MADAPAYVTRETVMNVGGYGSVVADRIDRAIFSRSRTIDDTLHRFFYPMTEAVTYTTYDQSWHVSDAAFWLNRDLQSVSAMTVDDTAQVAGTNYTLLPKQGPPYNRVAVDSYWNVDTVITGVWGFGYTSKVAGALSASMGSITATLCDVTGATSAAVGVGDLIELEDERCIVTGRVATDTTADLDGALTAQANDQTVTLTDATGFTAGEELLIGSERMLIMDVTGNDLSVERAYSGTTLAAHIDTTDVYAYRRLTITRGAVGTTATTHADATAVTVYAPPEQIRDWALAEVLTQLEQEGAGYARVVGSGDNQREARGEGLADARYQGMRLVRERMGVV